MSINRATLLGHVGNEPEVREGAGGAKFATFRLATTDRAYQRKDGTQVPERTEWHNIVVNGPIVQVVERYVHKGTMVYIEGKIRTRKYVDRNNVERYTTEILCDELQLCGGKPQESNPNVPFANQQMHQQVQAQNSRPAPAEFNDLPWEQ